jgi:hypothetical protein
VNLNDGKTFQSMAPFNFVVNCADTSRGRPDEAIDYCLKNGLTFVETTADLETIERIMQAERKAAAANQPGLLILGLGIFPGLSNIVARAVYDSTPECRRLGIGIKLNLISGAGSGMCALMIKLLTHNVVRYQNGIRVEEPPLSPGTTARFGKSDEPTLKAAFPESIMLHSSTRVPASDTCVAFSPRFLQPLIAFAARFVNHLKLLKRPLLEIMRKGCVAVRTIVLKNKATPVEITAVGYGSDSSPHHLSVRVDDGLSGAGYIIAAALRLISHNSQLVPGIYLPDEICELGPLLNQISELTGDEKFLVAIK